MNRITTRLQSDRKILSIYFSAGYPGINDAPTIIKELQNAGVDMIEIGLPFSDPLADGPTIQESSHMALQNGMTTEKLFDQLKDIRGQVDIPLLIMGYFNPILQFGVERFCQKCSETGIDGVIVPDLPLEEYNLHYREIFKQYGVLPVFLITPQTTEVRIREIDQNSEAFIYMVSSSSVTGGTAGFGQAELDYFKRIFDYGLSTPVIAGFGIKDAVTFQEATNYSSGAIVGSAFIKYLKDHKIEDIPHFIHAIKGKSRP